MFRWGIFRGSGRILRKRCDTALVTAGHANSVPRVEWFGVMARPVNVESAEHLVRAPYPA